VIELKLGRAGAPLSILCLGAHSDDIEIGCAATLLALLEDHPGSRVAWAVFSGSAARADEARASAAALLAAAASRELRVHAFRESYFPSEWAAIKARFDELGALAPDVVFTHHSGDKHQDHRVISELTWNTFRNQLVLEYEIPKFDGDLGSPQVFHAASEALVRRKCEHLREHFPSQRSRAWFDDDLFRGLMRIRGVECQSPTRFAEAFYVRKLLLS
jgi:LmbE family N-acetylglucosaminyl deacetylase